MYIYIPISISISISIYLSIYLSIYIYMYIYSRGHAIALNGLALNGLALNGLALNGHCGHAIVLPFSCICMYIHMHSYYSHNMF